MASASSLKWVWRGSALGVLGLGWLFILLQNKFHLTPSVVYVMLAYMAGIGAVYALFRMGASAVGPTIEEDPDAWVLPQSARTELEREKRTLLKAIKEAEFDAQMGKLSKRDYDEMVRNYRLRAIEVIKLLDEGGASTRDEILREVRARAEVEAMHDKVERAHAGLSKRRNPNKAAAAAQAAARAAAVAGASPTVAAAAAKQAAIETDLEVEDVPKATGKPAVDDYDDIEDAKDDAKDAKAVNAVKAVKDEAAKDAVVAAAEDSKPDEAKEATP